MNKIVKLLELDSAEDRLIAYEILKSDENSWSEELIEQGKKNYPILYTYFWVHPISGELLIRVQGEGIKYEILKIPEKWVKLVKNWPKWA